MNQNTSINPHGKFCNETSLILELVTPVKPKLSFSVKKFVLMVRWKQGISRQEVTKLWTGNRSIAAVKSSHQQKSLQFCFKVLKTPTPKISTKMQMFRICTRKRFCLDDRKKLRELLNQGRKGKKIIPFLQNKFLSSQGYVKPLPSYHLKLLTVCNDANQCYPTQPWKLHPVVNKSSWMTLAAGF